MKFFKNKHSLFYMIFIIIFVYAGFISYKYFLDKEDVKEYEFNFSTDALALTNFDMLVGDGFLYIPEAYYFERQTDKEISGYRLELYLNDEVIFDLTAGEPFKKYDHTLPGGSAIIYKNVSKNSNMRIKLIYTVEGIEYTFEEPIKLDNPR